MSASQTSGLRLLPMTQQSVDVVLGIEKSAYAFPWTRGNFVDSALAYFIAMPGVDEMHLLNITVVPGAQGHGHGRALLRALVKLCEDRAASELWLEVRQSNHRALRIYERFGFVGKGVRKRYYPAAGDTREDAVVMSLGIAGASGATSHALE